MPGSTLVHIGVRSTNLGNSIVFWRDALGLEVIDQTANHFDLTDGYHNFRVFQHGGAERPSHIGGMLDYIHIGVRVPDLATTAKRCHELGFEIFWDGVDAGKPYQPGEIPEESFKVADPDGIAVDVSASRDQWPGVEL
jgi:catechol 2,3-dioxygenase-like lactoylglutathione lyase family enzyme